MNLKALSAALMLTMAAAAQAEPGPQGMEHGPRGGPMHGPDGPMGHGPRMGEHGPGMPFLHGVKLSDEQQDKVFAIMHAAAPQVHEQEKALKNAREGMHELMRGRFDEGKAKALAEAEGKAVAALSLARARTHAQVLALLTPEQKQQLEAHPAPPPARH
ncbi:Spy/CpxP family protein refolding chaperone [Massilia sp. TS11]|uniref:Spy/CpxP family protein refolding chaperone n=1 Tax=Massilia sp. TS11 TaxID=2908003 RepID=UPI001EDC7569|nr:Spy/CpxP family protein refolding chaperone [Massilia sp. TS11]MCG2584603.1 Spy/CpxP family protein refolding chaperone [Massilia sp. TS11]